MFRIAVTDQSGTFTWHGWFSSYEEAEGHLAEAEDEFPDADCVIEGLDPTSQKSKWAEADSPTQTAKAKE